MFGLSEKPIWLASLLGEPRHVTFGVIPQYVDHWTVAAAPAIIQRPYFVAAAIGDTSVPPIEGQLELPDRVLPPIVMV
jgi:hypothetical protein